MSKLLIFGILVCLIATIASTVSTAIPYWLHKHGEVFGQEGSVSIGLWRSCIKYKTVPGSGSTCGETAIDIDWWRAVKALMIIGIALLAFSTLLGCLYAKFESKSSFIQGSVFMAFVGGIVLIIAVIVFGVEEKENRSSFSASFILAVVAGALAIMAGGIMGAAKRSHAGYSSI